MSKSISNNKPVSNKQTLYCKVCHDSGKPESEYRSHSTRETRDPNSRVTCPVLLAIECRFCHGAGHTVKYCAILKNKKREDERASKKYVSVPKTATIPKANVANMFDCLLEEEKVVLEEEIQEVLFNTVISAPISHLNYAVALAKPAPLVRQITSMPAPTATTNKKSWAMMNMESDSDDDEEVQEEW